MGADIKSEMEIIFPYYINQKRLLDIYSILNNGYSEYSEITTSLSKENGKDSRIKVNAGVGFKLLSIGAETEANFRSDDNQENRNTEKKVQTVTSVLNLVRMQLKKNNFLCKAEDAKAGSFIEIPVKLKINSIKSLLSEMTELMKLINGMQKLGVDPVKKLPENKDMESVLKSVQVMFAGEEIVFETANYAIVGNIIDEFLYQSTRADLIGTDLICLAQVKRVHPEGAELMRNTIFTKIRDANAKNNLIREISKITEGNVFDFEASAVSSIRNKPVYELEIIALYQ